MITTALASINWRIAFLCVPAVAAICLPLESRVFPRMAPSRVRRELYGVAVAGVGIIATLYGVSQSSRELFSVASDGPSVLGVLLVIVAAIIGLRAVSPAFPVRIFRSPVFLTAALVEALWNFAVAIIQLQASNLWQYAHGASAFASSLLEVPFTLAIIVASVVAGRLLSKGRGPRELISGGFLVVAIGLSAMALTGASPIVIGLGTGAASVAQSQIMLTEAPKEFMGPIAASRTTFGQIG